MSPFLQRKQPAVAAKVRSFEAMACSWTGGGRDVRASELGDAVRDGSGALERRPQESFADLNVHMDLRALLSSETALWKQHLEGERELRKVELSEAHAAMQGFRSRLAMLEQSERSLRSSLGDQKKLYDQLSEGVEALANQLECLAGSFSALSSDQRTKLGAFGEDMSALARALEDRCEELGSNTQRALDGLDRKRRADADEASRARADLESVRLELLESVRPEAARQAAEVEALRQQLAAHQESVSSSLEGVGLQLREAAARGPDARLAALEQRLLDHMGREDALRVDISEAMRAAEERLRAEVGPCVRGLDQKLAASEARALAELRRIAKDAEERHGQHQREVAAKLQSLSERMADEIRWASREHVQELGKEQRAVRTSLQAVGTALREKLARHKDSWADSPRSLRASSYAPSCSEGPTPRSSPRARLEPDADVDGSARDLLGSAWLPLLSEQ